MDPRFAPKTLDVSPPPYADAPPAYDHDSKSMMAKLDTMPAEIKSEAKELYREIKKVGLENHEARVCMVLDISVSMQHKEHNQFFFGADEKFENGKVQRLINSSVALALLFDNDGEVEVHPFAGTAYPPVIINRDNFTYAARLVWEATRGVHGSTNYAAPVQAVRAHYFKDAGERTTPLSIKEAPVFSLFITDGDPNMDKTGGRNQFQWASHLPIFFKFLALRGNQQDAEFSFLKDIDDPANKSKFFIDNADLVILNQPEDLTMQQLIHEYRGWLMHAHRLGLIGDPKVRAEIGIHSEGRIIATPSVATTLGTTFAPVVPPRPTAPAPGLPAKADSACCRIS